MKKCLLLMVLVYGNVYAEPETLPPVIDNSSYYGDTNQNVAAAVNQAPLSTNSASANYQILGQLEQLQKEVRQLSGTIEEQAHELAELKKRQTTMYEDIDQRVQSIEEAKKTAEAVTTESTPAELTPPVPALAAETAAPVAAAPTVAAVSAPAAQAATGNPQENNPAPKAAAPSVETSDEKDQYQKAYANLQVGHYAQGITALNAFLGNFPNGKYAANAQYWLGEAYKASQNNDASRDAFNKVINSYPNSPKVPDALFKLGILELDQNNPTKAREYLNQVSTGYPNTTAAKLAAKKLSALNGGL
ncbi:MAG: tol-pal system protein YbgF [Methylococcales bacterium]